jgi:hypothetical protein
MIFKYLWYKLYKASLKSSLKEIPILFSGALFSLFIHLNIVALSIFFSKLDIFPIIYQNKTQATLFSIVLLVLSWGYFNGNRAKTIIDRFSKENKKQRIRGNIFVTTYIILSIILLFMLMFYKPGYPH